MASRIEDYEGVEKVLREVTAKIRVRRETESVSPKQSYGRVASEDVLSPLDIPSQATSHMDGFAVIAADLQGAGQAAPVGLKIVGEIGPISKTSLKIGHGEAAKVATGAPLPEGADSVIPAEQATVKGARVSVAFAPERGRWVFGRGHDIRKGEEILRKGEWIRAQDVGRCLSVGMVRTKVYAKPKVSILATGSELTDSAPKKGKIRNSHSSIFYELVKVLGCEAVDEGIAEDVPSQVLGKLRRALKRSGFVLTLGGTSVGKRDVVGEAVSRLHPDVSHHGIRMDRGRVAGFAVVKGKPILMMPGPIQGAMNAFLLFGVPTIDLLTGGKGSLLKTSAHMKGGWNAREHFSGFTKVLYVRVQGEVAEPIVGDTESMSVLTKANGFVVVPEEVTKIQAGEKVEVKLMPGFSFA
ncbi:MAG TPA: molybdopterin molybdotransferase MoeA [Nitrososphaerales archaeon]|nr:molybdopterin molybdotransferase MoeA [Nitrososphaerales archaeon]